MIARTLSGHAIEMEFSGGLYGKVSTHRETSADLPLIAPGLIDIQVNGFAGIDFNRPLASDEAWEHATGQLQAHGCTGFLVTLITNEEEGYRQLLAPLTAQLRRSSRNALGFHMEGPWLNPEPAFRGAHRAEWMQKPTVRLLQEWKTLTGDLLRLVTLAPEVDLPAALEVMKSDPALRFFIGHSGAMGEILKQAIAGGAVGWTHLGNAAPPVAPKFENVMLHALAQPGFFASLIPDGIHLPPHAFRALARALLRDHPSSRLILTTDAMAGAGANREGLFSLGQVEALVAADGSARLPGSGRLAGSTLTPFTGVINAMHMADINLAEAWAAFSERPAHLLGLRHGVAEGNHADFCLLSPEKVPCLLATYQGGKRVHHAG